jgi:hypothetical protein
LILAITTRATRSGTETPQIAGVVVPPTTAIAMTTGGNPTSDRMTAMTRVPGGSVAVQQAIDKPLMNMAEIVAMMHG